MVIRIRLNYGSALRKTAEVNRQGALMMSSLMTPIAVMAWALGMLADRGRSEVDRRVRYCKTVFLALAGLDRGGHRRSVCRISAPPLWARDNYGDDDAALS